MQINLVNTMVEYEPEAGLESPSSSRGGGLQLPDFEESDFYVEQEQVSFEEGNNDYRLEKSTRLSVLCTLCSVVYEFFMSAVALQQCVL